MKRQTVFVIVVAVFVSAGAFLIATLQRRSERIAALKREIVVTQEQREAELRRFLQKTSDLRTIEIEKYPVGDFLTPLERRRRSPRTGRE